MSDTGVSESPAKTASERSLARSGVILLAVAGGLAVILMAFFTERAWHWEERPLYSVPYTFVHEGKLAFPAYGYGFEGSYDRMFVHPPAHYLEVAILMKLGMPLYYAEAVPQAFLAILCLFLIVTARFATPVQLGLLSGLMAGIAWIVRVGGFDYAFHLRPDMHMAMALLAGFLSLEAARAQQWELKRVFAGALLVTYGSTVHYPGWAGWLGLGTFLVVAWRNLPAAQLRRVCLAGMLGGCLIGIPYVVFHLIPNWPFLRQYSSYLTLAKVPETVRANLPIYRSMAGNWNFPDFFYAWPISEGLRLAIPPFVMAFILLIGHRQMRATAFGILPLSLFLSVFLGRKLFSYLYLETVLGIIGIWLLVTFCWYRIAARLPLRPLARSAASPAFAFLFIAGYWFCTPAFAAVHLQVFHHEYGQLRALSKQIIGPNTKVAAIHSNWYLSGGRVWFDLTRDILYRLPDTDLCTYVSRFDAIAVAHLTGFGSVTGVNESTLYEDGVLSLRGFMGSRIDPPSRWFWLTPRKDSPVDGFFWRKDVLFRFHESAGGDHTIVSVVVAGDLAPFVNAVAPVEYWAEDLPKRQGKPDTRYLAVLLLDDAHARAAGKKLAEAKTVETIRGYVEQVPWPYPQEDAIEDHIMIPRSYGEFLATLASAAQPPSKAHLDLTPAGDHATVTEVLATGVTEIIGKKRLRGESLAIAKLPPLVAGSDYRVTFNLALSKGGIWIALASEGQDHPPFSRAVPCKAARESFVFHYGGGPQPILLVNANNAYAPASVHLQMSDIVLERVEIPARPATTEGCRTPRGK